MIMQTEYSDKETIQKKYHLHALCISSSVEKENIITSLQGIEFFEYLLKKVPEDHLAERIFAREIIINSFSVLEALVISLGYKIQTWCAKSNNPYPFCSNSLFQNKNSHLNERHAFNNAEKYLRNIKILGFSDKESKRYYQNFRSNRNKIHIVKSHELISDDSFYTKKYVKSIIVFLQKFTEVLSINYKSLLSSYGVEME